MKKDRPQTKNILPFRYEPTYTRADLSYIYHSLSNKVTIEEIFKFLRERHPKTSDRTFYRWVEGCAKGKIELGD